MFTHRLARLRAWFVKTTTPRPVYTPKPLGPKVQAALLRTTRRAERRSD